MKILKIISVVLLLFLSISASAFCYNDGRIILSGDPKNGWIIITPDYDYYAEWYNKELIAMWIGNNETNCIVVENGSVRECLLREFSIIMSHFPYERISKIRSKTYK